MRCLRLRELNIGVQLWLDHHCAVVTLCWSDDLVDTRRTHNLEGHVRMQEPSRAPLECCIEIVHNAHVCQIWQTV